MSSVFSKLIDSASARYGVRQDTLTRGIAGVAIALYLLKLAYPHVITRLKHLQEISKKDSESSSKYDKNNVIVPGHLPGGDSSKNNGRNQRSSVGLDRNFLQQLITLLRIMVPGWRSREAGLLACATLTLLTRTFLSVYVAALEGQIVKRIVLRDVRGFGLMLARWFAIAMPATFVNSAIRYLEGRLALSFRFFLPMYGQKTAIPLQTDITSIKTSNVRTFMCHLMNVCQKFVRECCVMCGLLHKINLIIFNDNNSYNFQR